MFDDRTEFSLPVFLSHGGPDIERIEALQLLDARQVLQRPIADEIENLKALQLLDARQGLQRPIVDETENLKALQLLDTGQALKRPILDENKTTDAFPFTTEVRHSQHPAAYEFNGLANFHISTDRIELEVL